MAKDVGEKYFIYLSDKKNGCWYYLQIKSVNFTMNSYTYESIETNDHEDRAHMWFTFTSEMDKVAIRCNSLNVALKLKALHGI